MRAGAGLRYGSPGPGALHLCVDMQRLFAEEGPWHAPSLRRILPSVARIAAAHAERTIFLRFIPPENPQAAPGAWRPYYDHWRDVTRDRLPVGLTDLVAPLAALVPPAAIVDKATFGGWSDGTLHASLAARGIDTLILTGGETDVCVLASVLGAVDLGYRTIVVGDAVCSSCEPMHVAVLDLLERRFDRQVEIVPTHALLDAWPAERRLDQRLEPGPAPAA